jgi:multidrug efflux pump subunit AcrB
MSHFFIERPIFAMVMSIVITLGGGVAVFTLPVAQYPEITPPTVSVTANYPGASADVVADTVAAPIEQQVNGVENMLYMYSQSNNDGSYTLNVTFKLGVDLNISQVLVQNRVAVATPQLPETVRQQGVVTKKKSPSILLVVNLISPDGSYKELELSNYATVYVRDELSQIAGVGDVNYMGQLDYSMRFWLDPDKLAQKDMTVLDAIHAIKEQNVQVAAGQIGQPPTKTPLDFQYTMRALGRLKDTSEFENIVLKTGESGEIVRVKDVAKVELGAKSYNQTNRVDGKPSVGLTIYQLPGSNALDTAEAVKKKMEELSKRFPAGIEYRIYYDTTPFIDQSIHEVFKALRDAIILVGIVVLVFLQGWRTTLIPLIAVPVSIVGTFAVMALMGFSLNNLSLFGLVLAIGIVVDDAIVVVENVETWMAKGLSPKEAAHKAMDEVSGPVIAIGLVLTAVFVPCAFISGITGQFFRQFALTIAVSTLISVFNSLTLSPALAGLLLKHHAHGERQEALPKLGIAALFGLLAWLILTPRLQPLVGESATIKEILPIFLAVVGVAAGFALAKTVNFLLAGFFAGFNRTFDVTIKGYGGLVHGLLRLSIVVLLLYVGLVALTGFGFVKTPIGFIPTQDKGYALVNIQLPDSASLTRTEDVMAQVENIALKTPGVAHTVSVSGQSVLLSANGSNYATTFVIFKEFADRHGHAESGNGIIAAMRKQYKAEIQDALIAVFPPPAVDGLGSAGGFKLMIRDLSGSGYRDLQEQTDAVVKRGNETRGLVGLFNSFRASTPQLYVNVDREKVKSLGVPLTDVFTTLQAYLGSLYVNDFNYLGRTWQVNIQAESGFRATADQVKRLQVRNADGEMVPIGTLAVVEDNYGPSMVVRYNSVGAAAINGATLPGVSSGQAIQKMDAICADILPKSMDRRWTELTYLQILAGNTAIIVFALAVVLVFLVLAAQYESWALPLAVILVVPMCLLSAIIGIRIAGLDIDIFAQIGFVVLVGLASKNAILIVEFAKVLREQGKPTFEAAVEACKQRLRPILMTSFAFILGVVPLVLGHGAGAEMRFSLGVAVFSGMLGVTFFGLLLTPVFFYVILRLTDRGTPAPSPEVLEREVLSKAGDGVHVKDGAGQHDHHIKAP